MNDIIARWRDAINDPPRREWEGSIKRKDGRVITASYWERHGNWRFRDIDIEPGDQWLDVTTIPAVAVSRVQAAVDEMFASEATHKQHMHESNYARGATECAYDYRECLRQYTGVTPSEVTP